MVELAVDEKKLVVVALVPVAFTKVKFWRVEEPVSKRLESVVRPLVTVSVPVKLAAEEMVWLLIAPEVIAAAVMLPVFKLVEKRLVELAVVEKRLVVVALVVVDLVMLSKMLAPVKRLESVSKVEEAVESAAQTNVPPVQVSLLEPEQVERPPPKKEVE